MNDPLARLDGLAGKGQATPIGWPPDPIRFDAKVVAFDPSVADTGWVTFHPRIGPLACGNIRTETMRKGKVADTLERAASMRVVVESLIADGDAALVAIEAPYLGPGSRAMESSLVVGTVIANEATRLAVPFCVVSTQRAKSAVTGRPKGATKAQVKKSLEAIFPSLADKSLGPWNQAVSDAAAVGFAVYAKGAS